MRVGLLAILLLAFVGCKDSPYQEPVVIPPPEQTAYSFSGVVELGTPVTGATIVAHKFTGLTKGDKIGEAISNRDGSFDLSFRSDYDGPLLLTAGGGLYRDLVSGEMTALKPSQELRSAITHIKMPEKTNINAWTTMAVARVFADRGFWDKSVAELEDIDRINVDFSHVSYFLSGRATNQINIRRQEFFDVEKDSFKLEDPKVALHLAHGGLSQLAKDFSARLAEEGLVISVVDLVSALTEDLSDRQFDGRNANGAVVSIGNNHRINMSSYTMRKELSEAILLYSKRLQGLGKLSEEDKRTLETPGRIIDSIARDTRPELFPDAEQPKPLDRDPPKLSIDFGKEHSSEKQFAFLFGNVFFDVEAHDDSPIQEIAMLEPQVTSARKGNSFGPILVNDMPQAMKAAQACGKVEQLKEDLKKREISEVNVICACFEAKDVFDNTAKELSCFQRAVPKATISFPISQTVLSSKSFSDGVKLNAKISSGLPISGCSWRIQDKLEGEMEAGVLPHGKGVIQGTSCSIDDAIDGAKLFNGNYYLVIEAEDLAGRVLSDKQDGIYQSRVNFQVFKDPPAIDIVSPSNDDYLSSNVISVFGKN